MASVLFNLGSTFSYISVRFALGLNMAYDMISAPIHVSTPVEDSNIVTQFYREYLVVFMGFKTYVDLVIFDMLYFDIILGMTYLSPYFSILNCNDKM